MVMAKVVGTVWMMELLEVDVLGLVVGTVGILQLIFEQMGVLVFLDILKVVDTEVVVGVLNLLLEQVVVLGLLDILKVEGTRVVVLHPIVE